MIKFIDYSFSYGTEDTESGVQNIDLSIRRGECVLFCGASGCGKSTILKSINGLIPHLVPGQSKGSVSIDNRSVKDIPMYEIAKLTASVFQNPKSQFFNTDVESEIVYSLENRGVSVQEMDKRLDDAAKRFRIEHLLGKSMFELSGGEKQQTAFAGAFVSGAPVIVLDEPTANLDISAIDNIRTILLEMKKAGKTIVIAEHRLAWLHGIADTVHYMECGKITESFSGEVFFSMDEDTRKTLGLRELSRRDGVTAEPSAKTCSGEPVLEADNLALGYKKSIIQSDVKFSLYKGEILGIVGINGAGKTTLLRTLSGLIRPLEGKISLNGKPAGEQERRKRFGMVMQDVNYQLFSDSCENECCLGNPGTDNEMAKKLLGEVGLADVSERHPQSLSGGQKQRLALAVSKASSKEILLLDEPTSGLDYASMVSVHKVLRGLADEGKGIIVVTHDMEFAEMVCNRFICLCRAD
ncbi:MAG: energy-coupling factor ABC transporter ATP-binding protein [Oscillospiraceae bacterium]|nr:energy-coupling factor ABC transporter ATP-binding protein [Oscillospiraceae bacterium]